MNRKAVVSALGSLIAAAITLVTARADALPIKEDGGDYPFYEERGKFGVGFNAGAYYKTFDYHDVCAAVPSREQALAQCREIFKPVETVDKNAYAMAVESCGVMSDGSRKRYCGKDGTYLEASADAGITAKLFGAKADILDLEGHAYADSTAASAGFSMSVVGKKIGGFEQPARLQLILPYTFYLFKSTASFGLGPLSVSVSAEAIGTFGLQIGAQAGTAGVEFDGTPFSNLDVIASASVGKWGAEAGVKGTVNLVDLRLPSKVTLSLASARDVRWSANSDLTFNALSGNIELYGKLLGKTVGSMTLFEWKGIPEKKYEVFSDGGLVTL